VRAPATLPTTDEEIWRYSRIEELDLSRYETAASVTSVEGADGLQVEFTAHPEGFGFPDVFAEMNAEHMSVTVIKVPAHRVVDQMVVVTHLVDVDGVVTFPRLIIEAGENSEVTVVERFLTTREVSPDALVVPVVQVTAGAAARVRYLAINELGDKVWQIGHQQGLGLKDSNLQMATVALGGDYARVRTDVRVAGSGASAKQIALYFAGDDQMHDFRTIQDHDAPYTHSDLLFKGAVQGHARSVYTGLIKIREHARGTAAFQTNRNLTLSEGSWAESVPNLEIETNDVKCSHASTVGPIDEDQRFYLESRGIDPSVAERLVVLGFFDEVLSQLPAGDLVDELRTRVAAKLGAGVR
jgi:Fe-S cluster assembly protein SufD